MTGGTRTHLHQDHNLAPRPLRNRPQPSRQGSHLHPPAWTAGGDYSVAGRVAGRRGRRPCPRQDSNLRPSASEADALSAAPRGRSATCAAELSCPLWSSQASGPYGFVRPLGGRTDFQQDVGMTVKTIRLDSSGRILTMCRCARELCRSRLFECRRPTKRGAARRGSAVAGRLPFTTSQSLRGWPPRLRQQRFARMVLSLGHTPRGAAGRIMV